MINELCAKEEIILKVFAPCMQCQIELGHPSFEPIFADYFDDGIGFIECSAGHKSAIMLQSVKFEILLESGASALLNGYTLEASATFSTALERFYEFAIRVMCLVNKLPNAVYEMMFSEMSRQSERQMGAFFALYAINFGKAYKPNRSIVEFRNAVIHKGKVPKPTEAESFATTVYDEIYRLYSEIHYTFCDQIRDVIFQELKERNEKIPPDTPRSTTTGTTFFCIANSENKSSFAEALQNFKTAQEMLSNAVPEMQRLHSLILSNRT